MLSRIDKGLHQHRSVAPARLPVISKLSGELPKYVARQVRHANPGEQQEAAVVAHQREVALPLLLLGLAVFGSELLELPDSSGVAVRLFPSVFSVRLIRIFLRLV